MLSKCCLCLLHYSQQPQLAVFSPLFKYIYMTFLYHWSLYLMVLPSSNMLFNMWPESCPSVSLNGKQNQALHLPWLCFRTLQTQVLVNTEYMTCNFHAHLISSLPHHQGWVSPYPILTWKGLKKVFTYSHCVYRQLMLQWSVFLILN